MYADVPDTLSQLIRTAFIPAPGSWYLVADFSAIEARVIAWLAGETWRMEVFEQGGDIYCASASQMFGVPVEKHGVNGHLRQKGKVAELALGYGGGSGALIAMGALKMGLAEDELPDIVDRWRRSSPRIVALWGDLERAAVRCVRDCVPAQTHGLRFQREYDPQTGLDFLTIALPAGRKLFYARPYIAPNRFGKDAVWIFRHGQGHQEVVGRFHVGRYAGRERHPGHRPRLSGRSAAASGNVGLPGGLPRTRRGHRRMSGGPAGRVLALMAAPIPVGAGADAPGRRLFPRRTTIERSDGCAIRQTDRHQRGGGTGGAARWPAQRMMLSEFYTRLSVPARGSETLEAYLRLPQGEAG